MNKLKSGRVILDEGAKQALSSMYEEIKIESCVKITPSRLASWIIYDFYENYFEKRKNKIKKDHFNSKEYLKKVVQNIEEGSDIEAVLKSTLSKLKPARAKKKEND